MVCKSSSSPAVLLDGVYNLFVYGYLCCGSFPADRASRIKKLPKAGAYEVFF